MSFTDSDRVDLAWVVATLKQMYYVAAPPNDWPAFADLRTQLAATETAVKALPPEPDLAPLQQALADIKGILQRQTVSGSFTGTIQPAGAPTP